MIPNATATGRNALWSGARRSSTPNGRNLSIEEAAEVKAEQGQHRDTEVVGGHWSR